MTADDVVTLRKPSVRAVKAAEKAEREAENLLLSIVCEDPHVTGWKPLRKALVQEHISRVLGARAVTVAAKAT